MKVNIVFHYWIGFIGMHVLLTRVIGLTFLLLGFAIKALIVGGIAYLVIRVVSPDTARRLRDRWSGTSVNRL